MFARLFLPVCQLLYFIIYCKNSAATDTLTVLSVLMYSCGEESYHKAKCQGKTTPIIERKKF